MEIQGQITIYSYQGIICSYENAILRQYDNYIEVEYEIYSWDVEAKSTGKWSKAYYSKNIIWKANTNN